MSRKSDDRRIYSAPWWPPLETIVWAYRRAGVAFLET